MKRSKSINLARMRKKPRAFALKPLSTAIAAGFLVACSNNSQEAMVYRDAQDCSEDNPSLADQCEAAYQKALADAAKSGPKYRKEYDCEFEFGDGMCMPYDNNGNDWFMPVMAGFLFSQALDRSYYRSAPFYTSYERRSPFYGHWISVDGHNYGRSRYGKTVKVDNKAFKPKPKVTRTVSRGGFGSTVTAKSSRGSGSSFKSGGWGG